MNEKERIDKIAEYRSEMRSMLESAEAKGQDFTAEEQEKFNKLEAQMRMHLNYFKANEEPILVSPKKEERKIHDIFGDNLRAALKENRQAQIEVRATAPITAPDVSDTVPVLFQDIIDALTPALIIEKTGAKMQFNVHGEPVWPTVGDVEASWEGENVQLEDKAIDFGALRAQPHRMGLAISISRRALNQSNLDLYGIVVRKIAKSFAALLNKTMVSFTQVSGQAPKGVFITAAADPVELSENPTLKEVVALETKVMDENIEIDADGFGAYIVSTSMRGKLKTTPIEPGSPKMLLEDGVMNGYPVITTNYMPVDSIGFGFFEYAVVSQFGEFSLIFDPLTGASKNQVKFVGNTDVDITQVRPEAFAVGTIQ